MTLLERLHSEYHTHDGDLVLFRCTECGYTTMSIGGLHAHVEQHWPLYRRILFFLPWPGGENWSKYTEVLAVGNTEEIDLTEVEGL